MTNRGTIPDGNIFLSKQRLLAYLAAHCECKNIDCPRLAPANWENFIQEELDRWNCCRGCGSYYDDANVIVVDGVGSVCFNCLYNLAVLALGKGKHDV